MAANAQGRAAYRIGFLTLALLTLVASWEAFVLSPEAGAGIRPQRSRAEPA